MSEECKYIAVKNWGKYQERMKNGSVKRPFVRDAAHKDSDPDYSKLTAYQRYVLDGLRRLVAVHGRNPHNDPTWVARALCMLPRDHAHIAHAIRTLYAHHFLILTNERDPFSKNLNGMRINGMEMNGNRIPPGGGRR